MNITEQHAEKLFERGTVADVIPSMDAFIRHMRDGGPMHIYLGIDPTAENIHLGHVQNILFLEDMRKLGARVTLLFGSFTGLIGDPSDRDSARPALTRERVRKNMRTWRRQVSPILRLSRFGGARIDYNSRWFDGMSLHDFLTLLGETTVQQLLERDMFQKRLAAGKPLYANEMLYPILQGYDSVAMKVDAELCGTDQTFNALVGRTLVKRHQDREKFVITMNLIQADGVMMSKSAGTGVFVDMEKGGDRAMFGSIMALPDGFIKPLFRGCTRVPIDEVARIHDSGGSETRDAKLRLAEEIVGMFHGAGSAADARAGYIRQFSEKEVPDDVPIVTVREEKTLLALVAECAAESNADAKRKISDGAVSIDGVKVTDALHVVRPGGEHALRVGRRMFRVR